MLRSVTQSTVSTASFPHAPTTPVAAPPPASERLRLAWQRRHESDYVFDVATAFGWMLLTCGVYGLYLEYQLMRRTQEHNRRQLDLFDAATAFAWEQARAQGLSEELRPNFELIADRASVLGELTYEFRDPALWVTLTVVTLGIAQFVAWSAIDRDLVAHNDAERAIERELAFIYSRMGWQLASGDMSAAKGRHNVVGRVVATIASLGLYSFWWMRDLMVEGNAHLQRNWRFENDLARASQSLMAA
jgi:hypothetical protein